MKFGRHGYVRLPLLVLMTAVVLTGSARTAQAHLVTTGLGPVYDGISHFLLSPDDLIPVLALALLAGLRVPSTAGAWPCCCPPPGSPADWPGCA
jgi:hydrogenase/urease accessory protein HupE